MLSGQWGRVFGPLDVDIDRGGLNLIAAPRGAARTAFLMALCGRMKLKSGHLTVLGHTNDHRAVFKQSNIACFDELDAPHPSVTVQDLITEQIRWESGFFKWVPLAKAEDLEEMCGYLFEGLSLPPIDAFVADLPELHQLLLRIAVANTRRPPLLVVGRLDAISDEAQQDEMVDRLVMLGEEQSVIAADVNASDFDGRASEVVEVRGLFEFQQRIKPARALAEESRPINAAPSDQGDGES
jgi:ABC-type dipeptide/oligopeptide/nickel transport system ATPase subunit